MKVIFLICFICVLKLNKCQRLYIVPKVYSEHEESYVLDGIEYVLSKRKITWYEADAFCSVFGTFGSLAIVDTVKKETFLSECIKYSDLPLRDIWINWNHPNASYHDDNVLFTCKSFRTLDGNHLYRFRPCTDRRPFLCQRIVEDGTKANWTKINNYGIILIDTMVSWREAVKNCILNYDGHLVSSHSAAELTNLLKNYSTVTDIWVGAYYKFKEWRSLTTGQVVTVEQWKDDELCLTLVKQKGYVPANCDLKKKYVCAKGFGIGPEEIFYANRKCYTFFFSTKTWYDAHHICRKRKSRLLELSSTQKINDVLNILDKYKSMFHIWIGGRLLHDIGWIWVHSKTPVNFPKDYFVVKYFMEMPHFNCLTMDKEIQKGPVFYGTSCYEKQYFVCEKINLTKTECKRQTHLRDFDVGKLENFINGTSFSVRRPRN